MISGQSGRLSSNKSLLYVGVIPLVLGLLLLAIIFFASHSPLRFGIEPMKHRCFLLIWDSMLTVTSKVVSAEELHLTGRPWIVRRIFLFMRSMIVISVFVRLQSSAPNSIIGHIETGIVGGR